MLCTHTAILHNRSPLKWYIICVVVYLKMYYIIHEGLWGLSCSTSFHTHAWIFTITVVISCQFAIKSGKNRTKPSFTDHNINKCCHTRKRTHIQEKNTYPQNKSLTFRFDRSDFLDIFFIFLWRWYNTWNKKATLMPKSVYHYSSTIKQEVTYYIFTTGMTKTVVWHLHI